jgi:heptosyltransferase II
LPSASLVVQTSFLGDMVLTTPLIAYLAQRGPVDVVATPAAAALLANNPDVRDAIVYDKRGADRGVRGIMRLARGLRDRDYAATYLCQGSARSGALVWLARIPRRVGFVTSAGRRFYTERLPYIDNTHHAARLLSLGTGDTDRMPERELLQPRLYPGDMERAQVDALLAGAGIGHDARFVALAPGSVWATKRWPYYAELAMLVDARDWVVVIGGAADGELASAIARHRGSRVLDATGKLSLLASAELIRRARVLVTNDSAPQHLASAVRTPTVAIFGPTVPEFGFGPLAPRAVVAGHADLACRPCDRHGPQRCPLGHWRCMREITPHRVAELARDVAPT